MSPRYNGTLTGTTKEEGTVRSPRGPSRQGAVGGPALICRLISEVLPTAWKVYVPVGLKDASKCQSATPFSVFKANGLSPPPPPHTHPHPPPPTPHTWVIRNPLKYGNCRIPPVFQEEWVSVFLRPVLGLAPPPPIWVIRDSSKYGKGE
jgi:hypothetical protein